MLAVVFGGRALYGIPEASGVRVGIVQPNFPQVMKWDPEYTLVMVDNTAHKTQLLLEHSDADIVVWPEAVAMRDPQRDEGMSQILSALATQSGIDIILGAVRDGDNGESFNSSFHIGPDGVLDPAKTYDKNHLAPFGEYIPLEGVIPFLRDIVPAIGDVDHGEGTTIFDTGDTKIGPLICFEVLFPGMAMHYRDEGADALAVMTNLGWFGASAAQGQELEMARFRAIETRMPLIHAANTGISGVFDPYGRFAPVTMLEYPANQVREMPATIAPVQSANYRMFGAFPLAKRAPHPLSVGPIWFPRLVALFTVVAVIVVVMRSRKPAAVDE